jgi:hypothetical protein
MSKLETPQVLNDLYRDLRDRRLLLPAIALLVALVAVPVLLAKSPPPQVAPAAAAPAPEATAAQSAVLAEQVGIRDYRERLKALKTKNPFKQKFALPTPESVALAPTDPGTVADPATTGVDTSGSIPSSSTSSSTSTSAPVSGTGTSPSPAPQVKKVTKLITRRIDVAVGVLGETERVKNVRELDFLPSDDAPVVAFLGVSEDAKRAAFLVSADVISSDGDGSCVPDSCQFLTLKRDQQRYLHYQPEGESEAVVYRLKLLRVRDKVVGTE